MRALPAALQAHLDSGTTTLCRCWIVRRTDGVVQGFTDHDRTIEIEGVRCDAESGMAATGDVTKRGFGVGGLEIEGALSSDGLDPLDLETGRYDGAVIELWLVNWQAVEERVLLRRGTLGEVACQDRAFRAEVRGPMQALETVRGRVYTHTCDADLGEPRCGVDLTGMGRNGRIVAVDGVRVELSELAGDPEGWFTHGVLAVVSGAERGATREITAHRIENGVVIVTLRSEVLGVKAGDRVTATPGCDKRFATCRSKFQNHLNFQGFPHLVGPDRAFSYARSSSS